MNENCSSCGFLTEIENFSGTFGIELHDTFSLGIGGIIASIAGFYILLKLLWVTLQSGAPGWGITLAKQMGWVFVTGFLVSWSGLGEIINQFIIDIVKNATSAVLNVADLETEGEGLAGILDIMESNIYNPVEALDLAYRAADYSVWSPHLVTIHWLELALLKAVASIIIAIEFIYLLEFHFLGQFVWGFLPVVFMLFVMDETRPAGIKTFLFLIESGVVVLISGGAISFAIQAVRHGIKDLPVGTAIVDGEMVDAIDPEAFGNWIGTKEYWILLVIMVVITILLVGMKAYAMKLVNAGAGGIGDTAIKVAGGTAQAVGTAGAHTAVSSAAKVGGNAGGAVTTSVGDLAAAIKKALKE